EKDTGFEVSPDEVEPSLVGIDDQMDAIPISSSSDSLSTSDELDARATLPTPSDILVSYSTFPGYVSWRDTQAGSWYVKNLDRVLEENAATDDLGTMLLMVRLCLVKLLKTTDRYNKYVLKNGKNKPNRTKFHNNATN
ncbi:caspase-9-like, partial [Sinocyclocheilus grahami]|uniref:caspase-9-like n=1 Tax=Sinocyclocheilus grahami TaxID=75366 RepID=UPI0007AC630F